MENRAPNLLRDNVLLRRNGGNGGVIPGAIFRGIFTAAPDTLLYHFHFIPRINYRAALIGPLFARQITRADKLPPHVRARSRPRPSFRKYFPI